MNSNTTYVITGVNRGLGLGLLKALVVRPYTTVIGTVRSEAAATGLKAHNISIGVGSHLYIAIIDLSTAPSPIAIKDAVNSAVGNSLDHVDVLINNAGVCPRMTLAAETTAEDLRIVFETNTIAPLMVFQALWPLMRRSKSEPKLIMMSSSVGSIGQSELLPGGAYGASKAALNWITRSLHLQTEREGLVAVALHPGWVQTRAGSFVAEQWGYASGPPDTLESSVRDILGTIDEATRTDLGGKFITQTRRHIDW
ncbi:hypothetical protein COCCADRAFT_113571 [Bipolaris zeicola 26-R-13]|uniref:Aflatoxin biosynthesis ketoreductase nor-1 n=1 Tax=Cochliobolus carbonum (strain 26-R-13) TaxID=930089 RepID=W6Y631_COCC2|nr:uncharacterized protein COCCADRAFT_113571 [Bipolaris zeicola 26-R-13]EUC26716.1 hypothetical protein COCCADRAFT_113571 [Bipolaris zeicola 26-R-13]